MEHSAIIALFVSENRVLIISLLVLFLVVVSAWLMEFFYQIDHPKVIIYDEDYNPIMIEDEPLMGDFVQEKNGLRYVTNIGGDANRSEWIAPERAPLML